MQNKQVIKTALSGYSGRIGMSLQKLIKKSPHFKLCAKARSKSCLKYWNPERIDAVIDFSSPSLCSASLAWALQHKKAYVSGTTALSPKQKQELKTASKKIPVFYSENMSAGIFLFSQWVQAFFDPEVKVLLEDFHHKDKKDKPSGTALRLKKYLPLFLQKNLKIKSYRKGKEFGTHRLTVKNPEEILIIEHLALNRELFSKGALQALLFILNKKAAYYEPKQLYAQKKLKPLF